METAEVRTILKIAKSQRKLKRGTRFEDLQRHKMEIKSTDNEEAKRKGQACTPQVAPGTSCLGY